MREAKDAYWDELGIAWTAIDPQEIAPQLKRRLRLQAMFAKPVVLAGLPLCLASGVLGFWTIWRGAESGAVFFVTRGIAIVAMASIAGFAAWSYKAGLRDTAQPLQVMIELALQRTQTSLRAIHAGYCCCAVAFLFGQAGYFIRLQAGNPPAMSPAEPLLFLVVIALVLFLLARKARQDRAKYTYLKHMLFDEQRAA